jgi:hypothetical protein
MTFVVPIMLAGLAAIAVPVIIHLLNRSKTQTVHWGAMQFLAASIATRQRRILLEEVILLALRCLLIALVVLAMARPFLPSEAGVPWLFVLPALLGAAIALGIAAAMWAYRRVRWMMLGLTIGLIALGLLLSGIEKWMQTKRWASDGGETDIALILDASGSMTLAHEEESNFARALEEARKLVDAARPGDAISLILAGPVPVMHIGRPTADHEEVREQLDDETLAPVGGSCGVLEAVNAAAASLRTGRNANKKIIFIGDGQSLGWRLDRDVQWQFVSDALDALPTKPKIYYLQLPVPEQIGNTGIQDVTFSRRIIGVDRPVKIDVKIVNSGSEPRRPKTVQLFIDGTNAATDTMAAEILSGSAETLQFSHHFRVPGVHVVKAVLETEDDMIWDDSAYRVVHVLDHVPVLIVDGAPSERSLKGASAFIELALNPSFERRLTMTERVFAFLRRRDKDSDEEEKAETAKNLVTTEVVPAEEIDSIEDLDRYAVIILANVPRLPESFTTRLADYTRAGGGVLVVPGSRSEPDSYNEWRTPAGELILPATLTSREIAPKDPQLLDMESLSHPAFQLLVTREHADIDDTLVSAYWSLEADESDRAVRVGGALRNGDPFIVEREFGNGYIVMLATMLDRRDANLPSLKSFLPFLHELIYHLADPMMAEYNVRPGTEFRVQIAADNPASPGVLPEEKDTDEEIGIDQLRVELPSGRIRPADGIVTNDGVRIRYAATHEPGLYQFLLPTNLVPLYVTNLTYATNLPFTVVDDVSESFITQLTETDYHALKDYVDIFTAESFEELTTAVSDDIPGEELWKYLVVGALICLLGELAMSRWISIKRRYHEPQTIRFGPQASEAEDFRQHAEVLLGISPPSRGGHGQPATAKEPARETAGV